MLFLSLFYGGAQNVFALGFFASLIFSPPCKKDQREQDGREEGNRNQGHFEQLAFRNFLIAHPDSVFPPHGRFERLILIHSESPFALSSALCAF